MNKTQQQLADRLGELLVESALDEEVKRLFLEIIEQIPERFLFKLKDSLEMEREMLENIVFEIQLFLKEQEENWQKTLEDQKKAAQTIADKWATKLG